MNKSLIAIAAITFITCASNASAQNTVTLFGVIDVGLAHFSQNGVSKTMMTHSGNTPTTLGFRGTEDLGDGMSANFWLAGGIGADDGGATRPMDFSFRSTISLAGRFGEIRLGRDYPAGALNQGIFDPFRNMGVASGANLTLPVLPPAMATGLNPTTSIRVNNSIQYLWGFAPNAMAFVGNGFYGSLMYAPPENTSGISRYAGLRTGYAAGPWNVAVGYAESTGPFGTPGPGFGSVTKYKERNAGASYVLGDVKLMGHIGTNDSNVPHTRYSHWAVGAEITVGPGYIPVSYITSKQNNAAQSKGDQIGVGYVYFLSKRTSLYTTAAHITNKSDASYTFVGGNGGNFAALTPGLIGSKGDGSAYSAGIRHAF